MRSYIISYRIYICNKKTIKNELSLQLGLLFYIKLGIQILKKNNLYAINIHCIKVTEIMIKN